MSYRIIARTKQVDYRLPIASYKQQWKDCVKAVMFNKQFATKEEAVNYLIAKGWHAVSTRRLDNSSNEYEACVVRAIDYDTYNDVYYSNLMQIEKNFYYDLQKSRKEKK